MNTRRMWIAAAALSVAGWVAVFPVGTANADCTTAGDFGAAAGCAPSTGDSSGSGKAESWPPTSVDWPPQLESDSDKDSGSKGGGAKPTPIVMPDGQKPPPATPSSGSNSTSTSTTPTPIVPVGAAPAATNPGPNATSAPIVTTHG